MTLAEVRDWLRTFGLFDNYYIGRIDGSTEHTLGVYANANVGNPVYAIGQPSSYKINGYKLLIHWNKNPKETQDASNALFDALTRVSGIETGNNLIYYVDLQCREPIDVGCDANDICEYVINMNIYSRR